MRFIENFILLQFFNSCTNLVNNKNCIKIRTNFSYTCVPCSQNLSNKQINVKITCVVVVVILVLLLWCCPFDTTTTMRLPSIKCVNVLWRLKTLPIKMNIKRLPLPKVVNLRRWTRMQQRTNNYPAFPERNHLH